MKTKIRNIIDIVLSIIIVLFIVIGLVCSGTYQAGKEAQNQQIQTQENKERLDELKELYKIAEDAQNECVRSCEESWGGKKNEYHTEAEIIREIQNNEFIKKAEELGLITSS